MQSTVKKNSFTVLLINDRSLKNKLASLEENMNEMAADAALITETWFKDDRSINELLRRSGLSTWKYQFSYDH